MKPRASILVAGSANVDFVVRAPHIPAPGETVLGRELIIAPGGKGANQAVACARAGGVDTTMLVALGSDVFAPVIEEALAAAGVALKRIDSERPTGAALICVADDAENAITVAPGANTALMPDDLPDLGNMDGLVLQLETPLPTVIAYAQAARAKGVRVFLNAAPAQTLPPELLEAVDVVVVNEEELAVIAGEEGPIIHLLRCVHVPCVVVTVGARGAIAFAGGAYHLQSAFTVKPVDTTGAGDTFCGAFAAALCRGEDLPGSLRTACAAAALATSQVGAQSSIPTLAEVTNLLETGIPGETAAAGLADYCGLSGSDPVIREG